MALFKYLKPRNLPDSEDTGLREDVTKQANIPVTAVLNENHKYTQYTGEQRAKIARYATESRNNMATVRHFSLLE